MLSKPVNLQCTGRCKQYQYLRDLLYPKASCEPLPDISKQLKSVDAGCLSVISKQQSAGVKWWSVCVRAPCRCVSCRCVCVVQVCVVQVCVWGPILDWPASGSDLHSTPAVTESFVTYKLVGASESGQIPLAKVVKCVYVCVSRTAVFSLLRASVICRQPLCLTVYVELSQSTQPGCILGVRYVVIVQYDTCVVE